MAESPIKKIRRVGIPKRRMGWKPDRPDHRDLLYGAIKPKLDLRSDWNNHMLNFYANANFGIYTASALENYQDVSVGTTGSVDIQRDWNVYGGGSFSHKHEDPGTPNAATGAVPPNQYDQIAGNLGYYQGNFTLSGRTNAFSYVVSGSRTPDNEGGFSWEKTDLVSELKGLA